MFESQLLFGAGGDGAEVFSPWFPRQGDNAICTLEVVRISGASIQVELFTKNSEDTGDGALVTPASGTGDITRTTVGRESNEWEGGLEELVRYKFTVADATTKWVLFRMLPPVWFDSADAS